MRNQTIKRLNILTAVLVVLALLLTFSAVAISAMAPRGTIVGDATDTNRQDMLDNISLTDTNGTIAEDAPLEIPEGYTGVPITNADELKAFLTDADATTPKYGYIELADGTTSIDLDWGTNNGTTTVMTANKIFDGRGYEVNLTTTSSNGNVMAIANMLNHIAKEEIEGDPENVGGWFLAANLGTIKNTQFVYSKVVDMQCKTGWTTSYGVVVGNNAGTIDNIKLTMTEGSKFYVAKQDVGESGNINLATIMVGGIAGMNVSSATLKGQVINSTAEINGELSTRATYKGGRWSWNTKGSSRATVAPLVGRLQGLDTLVQNCVVTGSSTGNITATTGGSGQSEKQHRHVATGVGANSEWGGTQGKAYGQINGIIDAYKGSISNATSGTQGGTFDCSENALNIYAPVSRSTTKRVLNCNCDHNSKSTYKTLDVFGANSNYKFTTNPGEVEMTLKFSDEELARKPQVHKHDEYDMTVADFKATIAATNTNITPANKVLEKDHSYTVPADVAGNNKFISSYFAVYYNITLVGKQPEQPLLYNGAHQSVTFDATYVTGEPAVVDEQKINKQYSSRFAGSEEFVEATNTAITGTHLVYAAPAADGGILYESFGDNIILKDTRKDAFATLYTIDKANITTNNPTADLWYNDFKFAIDMAGFADGAFDRIDYSTDFASSWTSVEGNSFDVTANGAKVDHKIQAFKSGILVTEVWSPDIIKFDNTAATISNVNYTKDINVWTTEDITLTFNAADEHSGLKTVSLVTNEATTALTASDVGLYTVTMTAHQEYAIVTEDTAGNIKTVLSTTPYIDKSQPTVTLTATYKDATGNDVIYEHNTSVVYAGINVTAAVGSTGPSGYTASYAVVGSDGNVSEYLPIEIVEGVVKVLIKTESDNVTYKFKIVSGAGVEAIADIALTIQKRKLIITNDNIILDETIEFTKTYDGTNAIVGQEAEVVLKGLAFTDGTDLTTEQASNLKLTAYYEDADAGTDKAIKYVVEANGAAFDEYGVTNEIMSTTTGTILPKEVTIGIEEHRREYGYDNTTVFKSTIEGLLGNDTIEYTLTPTAEKLSDVGTYDITVEQAAGSNYVITNTTEGVGKFIVDKRKVNVNYFGDLRVVYNKNEQGLTGNYVDINSTSINVTFKYYKEDAENGGYIETAPINAGKYKVEIVIADTNYVANGDSEIPDYTIARQTLKVEVSGWSGDFDGNEHPATVVNPDGIALAINYNNKTDVPVNAGRYHVEVSAAGYDNNYNVVDSTAEIVINQVAFPELVVEDITAVYNGKPVVLMPTTVDGGALPAGTILNYSISEIVNVGEYNVTVVVSNPNYFTQELSAKITITKADITDKISLEGNTAVFNGNEFKLDLILAEGFTLPEGITITWTNNGLTNVGKNLVGVTITSGNYNTVTLEAWLEVTPATIGEDIGFESDDMFFLYEGEDITITLEGNLEGYDVQYDRNVLTYAGLHYVKATVSKPNYATKVFTTMVTVGKYNVELEYTNLPKDLKIKVGGTLEGITASFVDLQGNVVEVRLTITGGTTEEGYITIAAKMPMNYVADNADLAIEVVKGANTGVIIGASVGGSVGGLAVAGGVVAFFVIKKKKSII